MPHFNRRGFFAALLSLPIVRKLAPARDLCPNGAARMVPGGSQLPFSTLRFPTLPIVARDGQILLYVKAHDTVERGHLVAWSPGEADSVVLIRKGTTSCCIAGVTATNIKAGKHGIIDLALVGGDPSGVIIGLTDVRRA